MEGEEEEDGQAVHVCRELRDHDVSGEGQKRDKVIGQAGAQDIGGSSSRGTEDRARRSANKHNARRGDMNEEKRTIGPVLRRSIVRAQDGTGGRSPCRVCRFWFGSSGSQGKERGGSLLRASAATTMVRSRTMSHHVLRMTRPDLTRNASADTSALMEPDEWEELENGGQDWIRFERGTTLLSLSALAHHLLMSHSVPASSSLSKLINADYSSRDHRPPD